MARRVRDRRGHHHVLAAIVEMLLQFKVNSSTSRQLDVRSACTTGMRKRVTGATLLFLILHLKVVGSGLVVGGEHGYRLRRRAGHGRHELVAAPIDFRKFQAEGGPKTGVVIAG